jgi:Fe-S oxidoreductase/nitrate reductase gamma subunit
MTTKTLTPETSAIPSLWRRLALNLQSLRPYLRRFFVDALVQRRVLSKPYPGIMHALIFWGVTVQIFGTAINLMQMQLFIPFVELPFPRGRAYLAYELVMDLAGAAILVGILMAMLRRWVLRPKTLETRWDDHFALVLLLIIPLAGFSVEGARLLSTNPEWAAWSPVGRAAGGLLAALGLTPAGAAAIHGLLFWTHASLGLVLVASLPFTKLRHMLYTPLHALLRSPRRPGVLEKIENIEEAEQLGVGKVAEFAPLDLLSFDACVRCGRCEESCPPALSGMGYSPKDFIQSLRGALQQELQTPENGRPHNEPLSGYLSLETAWLCTTCGACLAKCPAFVNPVDRVIDLRRYQILTTGKMPKPVGDTLRNLERQGNPWGMPPDDRLAWAEGLGVRELAPGEQTDVLLYLGCALAYDERSRKAARSLVRLLQRAGVDFAVLGLDETCCGETARRLGNEYLFQMFAEQTLEVLGAVRFNTILTQCAHCFNTLKNEYPQFGSTYTVRHYTEFLAELDLPFNGTGGSGTGKLDAPLAFHDSCYLGRYNDIYQAPRKLLDQAGADRLELPRSHAGSFCCGGGGGQMWMETDPSTRINHQRLNDVLAAGVGTVTTACPYCLLMFDDAIRSKGLEGQVQVLDLAEVLEERLPKESV